MPIKNIVSTEDFNKTVAQGYTLVDFHAIWCGPCKMLSPILEKLSSNVNDVNFIKVDIDQFSEIAHTLNIHSVPTVYLYKDGKPISYFVGFKNESQVLEFIEQEKKKK
jgi:thioredoxin 1